MFGIALALVAGICTGSFGFPMKFTSKWKWENTWSMWTVWTLLVVPWVIAFCAIPNLFEVFRQAGAHFDLAHRPVCWFLHQSGVLSVAGEEKPCLALIPGQRNQTLLPLYPHHGPVVGRFHRYFRDGLGKSGGKIRPLHRLGRVQYHRDLLGQYPGDSLRRMERSRGKRLDGHGIRIGDIAGWCWHPRLGQYSVQIKVYIEQE